MPRQRTEPTVTLDTACGTRRSHPSYAKITIGRVSGQATLFQSGFKHQNYICLRVSRCEVLGDDHECLMETDQLVEVAMSESQFARMITSIGVEAGSPCTLQRLGAELVEEPINEDKRKSHRGMVEGKLKGTLDKQLAIGNQVAEWRAKKHRPTLKELDALASQLHLNASHFELNMGYYASVLEEHMEQVLDDAKTELEAHALHTSGRLGLTETQTLEIESH